jgi:DNA-directed RNA polymerase subunit L
VAYNLDHDLLSKLEMTFKTDRVPVYPRWFLKKAKILGIELFLMIFEVLLWERPQKPLKMKSIICPANWGIY